jgi:protein SCO1/2
MLLTAVVAVSMSTGCVRSGHDAKHVQSEIVSATLNVQADTASPSRDEIAVTDATSNDAFSIFEFDSRWKDQQGRDVKIADVSGKATVVALIYTSCTRTCPLIVASLKRVEGAVRDVQQDVRFVLVSIDPDRDSPDKLAAFARNTKLDESSWTLLSGSNADIRQLAVTLDVRYQTQSDGEIAHTNGFSVIDRNGHVVHVQSGYSDVEQAVARLRAALR